MKFSKNQPLLIAMVLVMILLAYLAYTHYYQSAYSRGPLPANHDAVFRTFN